jgi:hypothetical protein
VMTKLWKDLAAWEDGDLTLADVEARHPGENIRSVIALQDRLWAVAAEPVSPHAGAWESLRAELRRADRAPGRRVQHIRLAAVAGLAVLAMAGAAYAAPPVRHGVGAAIERVKVVFTGKQRKPKPTLVPAPGSDQSSPSQSSGPPGESPRREKRGGTGSTQTPEPTLDEGGAGVIPTPMPSDQPSGDGVSGGSDGGAGGEPSQTPAPS